MPRWRAVWVSLACAMWALAACAPALNWRESTLEKADGLGVLFPCKPDESERSLKWPATGQPVTVRMHRCEADGMTWVVQSITLDSLARVEPTLREWPAVLLANLRQAAQAQAGAASQGEGPGASGLPSVADVAPAQDVQVPHMTPSAHARSVNLMAGPMRADPAWRQVRAWHFFHGLTVFQASVWSSDDHKPHQTSEDVTRPFFDGLRFPD
jgi:hypothetical protein